VVLVVLEFLQVLLGLQHFVAAAAVALVRTRPARAVPVEMAAAVPVRLPLAALAQAGLTGQPIQAAAAAAADKLHYPPMFMVALAAQASSSSSTQTPTQSAIQAAA
jgi:hypothetical protein